MSTRARRTWAMQRLYDHFKANTVKIRRKRGRPPGMKNAPYRRRVGHTHQGRQAHWQQWPSEPVNAVTHPASAGTVFGWAEHLVRSLVALQLEERCYGEDHWRLDARSGCELCGWREKRKYRIPRYRRTLGGWHVCRRCSGRVSEVNRQDPYGAYLVIQAREDDLSWQLQTHTQAPRAHVDDD